MPSDPTDRELLEFVARFAGWNNLGMHDGMFGRSEFLLGWKDGRKMPVPDYLNSVDRILQDIIPQMSTATKSVWHLHLCRMIVGNSFDVTNATARQRCLALYRALDGKLPAQEQS